MTIARRSFLRQAGVAVGVALGTQTILSQRAEAAPAPKARSSSVKDTFKLAMAGYTFNKFKIDETLKMLQRIDVHYLCIKDFHLPLQSTDAEIAAFHEKCKDHGVTGYGVGPIYMGSEAEVEKAFDYAKRVGVNVLVGVPFKMDGKTQVASPELLKLIDQKVREFDIRYAIHNHGPDMPGLFPSAESVMEMVGNLDKRVGLCFDIGHQLRDGKDPVQSFVKYADRVHDIHIKNVNGSNKAGKGVEMPRGLIDIPAFVRALRTAKYSGYCGLEYEKDMNDPLLGVAESIGYFRGVMDSTRSESA